MGYAYLTGDNPDWYRGYGPGMMGPVGNGGRGWGMMGPYGGWGMHSFFGFPWWLVLMTVLGLGGAITAVVWGRRSKDRPQENSALEVLKLRLAKGEITQKEYDTLKKKIE
ncbi:MAG TPA: hypothetical protein ENN69_01545 [Spirochaetia bacterium]|nr:hypothetical protein [Spirochaetia bacterium]